MTGTAERWALVGVPNCGKSSLFHALTGKSRPIGNFPGITVDVASAPLKRDASFELIDLPGLYALETRSPEEALTVRYLAEESCTGVLCVIDVTRPRRGLSLFLQLREAGARVGVILNMMDELSRRHGSVQLATLEKMLRVPVALMSARSGEGLAALPELLRRAGEQTVGKFRAGHASAEDGETHLLRATERFRAVEKICSAAICPGDDTETREQKTDAVVCGGKTGIPLLGFSMLAVFFVAFGAPAQFLSGAVSGGINWLTAQIDGGLTALAVHPVIHSLITDGILRGIGSVLGFLPMVLLLFLMLAFLEDSGYLSRVAFLTDRFLRPIGLSGNSFVPMLLGFGCTASAATAARTLPEPKSRTRTLLLLPFLSCSAKLPVFAAVAGVFFPGREVPVIALLYLLGVTLGLAGCALGNVMGGKRSSGTEAAYLLEFPPYRLPTPRRVIQLLREKTGDFLKRVTGVIFLASLLVWFLCHFDGTGKFLAENSTGESLLSALGKRLLPLFVPLGFKDWRPVAALLAGFGAKEAIISTLSVLLPGQGIAALPTVMNARSAVAFLVFVLLYPPCAAALSSLRREAKKPNFALFVVIFHFLLAYGAAYLVNLLL